MYQKITLAYDTCHSATYIDALVKPTIYITDNQRILAFNAAYVPSLH